MNESIYWLLIRRQRARSEEASCLSRIVRAYLASRGTGRFHLGRPHGRPPASLRQAWSPRRRIRRRDEWSLHGEGFTPLRQGFCAPESRNQPPTSDHKLVLAHSPKEPRRSEEFQRRGNRMCRVPSSPVAPSQQPVRSSRHTRPTITESYRDLADVRRVEIVPPFPFEIGRATCESSESIPKPEEREMPLCQRKVNPRNMCDRAINRVRVARRSFVREADRSSSA